MSDGNVLAATNIDIVHAIARKLSRRLPRRVELDDLVSDGYLGLLDAASKFDRSRDARFGTFASRRILGEMIDGLRRRDHQSRRQRARKNGPTLCSIWKAAGRDGQSLADMLAAPLDSGPAAYEQRDWVRGAVHGMQRFTRLAVELYFVDGLTMEEIGRMLGYSDTRISNFIAEAIGVMQERLIETN